MKRKILSLILVFAMTVSLLTVGTGAVEPTYGDTAGHWAESSIERWSGHGIIQGSNGLFDPNGQLTCAQLATILAKLLKLPVAKDAGFTDNTADAWYYDAINRCAAAGILNGNGDGTVTPEAPITRERAMVMLARALGIEPIRKPDLTKYTDAAQVSAYAQGYVAALIEAGIVGGVTADELAPQDNITRASTVTILDRAIDTYADEAGATVKADGKGIVLVVADDVTVTGSVDKLLVPANDIEVTVKGSKNIDDITVSGDNSKVILDNASADNVTLDGEKCAVETKNGAKIDNVIVTENAPGATVDVGSGTIVGNVENHAEDATVTGSGTVKKVESDKDITVKTKDTDVKNIGDEKITVTDKSGKDTTIGTTGSGSSTTVNKGTTSSGGGGGSYTPPAQHTHAWATAWSHNETHHWHECTKAGCTVSSNADKNGYAEHTFTNGVCVCGVKSPEVKATEDAWDALNTKLAEIKGNNDAALVTAARNGTAYTLLLDVDAIQSGTAAFEDNFLSGLATNLKAALDSSFGSYTLSVDNQDVYTSGTFNNTNLKNALFSVADGFFYTLSNMNGADGVYTYKTVDAKVTGTNAYSFTIAVQLKGEDVSKVKSLAGTLADHLQMEMLDSDTINNRYGITVNESKAIVVTMEMPDKLMQAGVDKIGSGENAQKAFDGDGVTVSALLGIMNSIDSLDGVLGNNASDVNSVLTTVNSNANVVNKVLSKMTAKVAPKNGTPANFVMTFTPGNANNAWKDFLTGVIRMVGDGVGAMRPNQFKVVGVAGSEFSDRNYYAVPVTVTIDLERSMGFQATETVVVVMHIDFSRYDTSNTQGQSAQSGNDLSESNAPEAEGNVNPVANSVAEGSDVKNSVEDLAK
ncbi:S-layer homology domain-containing protein [Dysosmobacter sp.]|uniref:S-layer homology domain-containing protein n=1 Tax=Dysosmobacter sp. TaxID=2591382 RepID=UPI003AEFCB84